MHSNSSAPATTGSPVVDINKVVGPLLDRLASRFDAIENRLEGLHSLLTTRRKDHLTVEEVADLVGRSDYTIRRWITEKKLNAIRVDGTGPRGKLLIPRAELERLVAEGRGGAIPDAALDS